MQREIQTVKQFAKAHPAWSEGSLRWLLFNRQQNGLDAAVVRVGRRLLIDESAFFDWLDEHREAEAGAK